MPEDPEFQDEQPLGNDPEETETETPESDPAGDEPEPSRGPEHIPYQRFQEVVNNANQYQQQVQMLQMQMLQMQQQYQSTLNSLNAPKLPEVDPDVAAIVDPVVRPMANKIAELENKIAVAEAKAEAEAAWNWTMQRIPDWDDLRQDFIREIESKPKNVQSTITSDPNMIIEFAEKVRIKRLAGGYAKDSAAKQDLKARSRSESGGVRTSPSSKSNIDWASLSDEEFAKAEAAMLRRR